MYYLPQPMQCPKCGHRGQYSIHETTGPVLGGDVICPKCFDELIRAHCGVMQGLKAAHDREAGGEA